MICKNFRHPFEEQGRAKQGVAALNSIRVVNFSDAGYYVEGRMRALRHLFTAGAAPDAAPGPDHAPPGLAAWPAVVAHSGGVSAQDQAAARPLRRTSRGPAAPPPPRRVRLSIKVVKISRV